MEFAFYFLDRLGVAENYAGRRVVALGGKDNFVICGSIELEKFWKLLKELIDVISLEVVVDSTEDQTSCTRI